jgi:hypothetical protein
MAGGEWQNLCLLALRVHEAGDLVTVPDQDRGDGGIECYSLRGRAYQTYSPQGVLAVSQRYERHRDKMTTDIGKFISNIALLKRLLGDTKISRWVLLVPLSDSKDLIAHAAAQTRRLRDAALPYATDDITVLVHTLDDDYAAALRRVLSDQLERLSIPDVVDPNYSIVDTELVARLRGKLTVLPRYADAEELDRFVTYLLTTNVQGQAHRDYVRDHFPELDKRLADEFEALQNRVEYELTAGTDTDLLALVMSLANEVAVLLNASATKSQQVAAGQVADWLMLCPLSFGSPVATT